MMDTIILIVIIITFLSINSTLSQDESANIKRLREELFTKRKYDIYSRPVKDHTKPVNISIWIRILKVIDLNIKTQILTMNAYVDMLWTDEHLIWNPSDFGGETELVVSSDMIWKPDISVVNGPDLGRHDLRFKESTLSIKYNGEVEWLPQVQFNTYCMTDLTLYPNDKQICRFTLEPWMYQIKYIDVKSYEHLNVTQFIHPKPRYPNPEWDVVKIIAYRKVRSWPIYGTFAAVMCFITLERRESLLYYYIKMPITVSILFSILMMFFPPNSKKRFALCSLSLIILTSVLLFITSVLGFVGNKGIPLIVYSTASTIVFIAVMMFLSSLLNNIITKWSINSPPLPFFISLVIRNPLLRFIGVANYLTDMCYKEGIISGITIGKEKSQLTESENEWILFALLIDKIVFITYIIFLLCLYS